MSPPPSGAGRLGLLALGAARWPASSPGRSGFTIWLPPGPARQAENGDRGVWAAGPPALYVAGYVIGELLFVPALPLAVSSAASCSGRYGAPCTRGSRGPSRPPSLSWSPGIWLGTPWSDGRRRAPGWRGSTRPSSITAGASSMLTRLIPLFPFNLQNFAYGLTRIPFWVLRRGHGGVHPAGDHCLHPGRRRTVQRGQPPRTIAWTLAAAGVLIVLVSLLPRWLGPQELGGQGSPEPGALRSLHRAAIDRRLPVLDEAGHLEAVLAEVARGCPGADVARR